MRTIITRRVEAVLQGGRSDGGGNKPAASPLWRRGDRRSSNALGTFAAAATFTEYPEYARCDWGKPRPRRRGGL